MKREIRERTISLIKEHFDKIGVGLPLDIEGVQDMMDYFEEIECTLANAKGCGDKVDDELLNAAADAYDDLFYLEEDDYSYIDELNERLMS
ncbi:MAG: hypothetical protein E7Z67_04505 [Thermoplasmata archaeon]|nr:hypothetical protein [Thermoplasmata archaeon]